MTDFFPIPRNEEVESQPVRECTAGRISEGMGHCIAHIMNGYKSMGILDCYSGAGFHPKFMHMLHLWEVMYCQYQHICVW
jgi:hypothetical protein